MILISLKVKEQMSFKLEQKHPIYKFTTQQMDIFNLIFNFFNPSFLKSSFIIAMDVFKSF
jgi:hypothetical protein